MAAEPAGDEHVDDEEKVLIQSDRGKSEQDELEEKKYYNLEYTLREEAMALLQLAIPTTVTRFLIFFTRMASILFIGRQESNGSLAAASLANSLLNVLGVVTMVSFNS